MPSVPESSLEIGLSALQQKDYLGAIAHLENLCQNELSENTIIKAQMGLVAAYQGVGEIAKAIDLTKELSNNSKPQVKEWATRQLEEFAKLYPELTKNSSSPTSTSSETGFVPLAQLPPPSPRQQAFPILPPTPPAQATPANTRFTPIENPPIKNQPSGEQNQRIYPTPPPLSAGNPVSQSAKTPEKELSIIPYNAQFKQAPRAQKWQNLPNNLGFKFDLSQLWGVQIISAFALIITLDWLVSNTIRFFIWRFFDLQLKLRFTSPDDIVYTGPTQIAGTATKIIIILLLISLPWFMDFLLKYLGGLESLTTTELANKSPEAARVLQRVCREKKLPVPKLFILSNSAPIALTYGNLRRTARIVVSQGLLEKLADDEIACVYATQLGHIIFWDFFFTSFGVLVGLLPYCVYYQFCQSGDRYKNVMLFIAGAIASLSYGLYWILRVPMLWLSRARINYSDRLACDITGNPNALSRALLKICIGIAEDIQQKGETSHQLESLELLNLVGNRQAMTLGSLYPHTALEPILAWDYLNPYRRWLTINNSHTPLGERWQILSRYARYWKLETELELSSQTAPKIPISKLILQSLPYFGILLGLALGGLLWVIGRVSSLVKLKAVLLDWMWGDWSLMKGCVLIGISIGIIVRLNTFFPDIKPTSGKNLTLPQLLSDSATLPIDSQPINWQGKLLGRSGIGNWLCQDLIFQTATGLIKLHHFSWFGPIGNVLPLSRPNELVKRNLTATGWFHRGATPWVDVETLRTQGNNITRSHHPIWSLILGFGAALWGAYIIYQGG